MAHQYGSSADYDKIAAETSDAGWAWDSVKKGIYKACLTFKLYIWVSITTKS